jgi:hypothetical protein
MIKKLYLLILLYYDYECLHLVSPYVRSHLNTSGAASSRFSPTTITNLQSSSYCPCYLLSPLPTLCGTVWRLLARAHSNHVPWRCTYFTFACTVHRSVAAGFLQRRPGFRVYIYIYILVLFDDVFQLLTLRNVYWDGRRQWIMNR